MTVEILDRCDVPCDGLIGQVVAISRFSWVRRDRADDVDIRSALTAVGCDLGSDVLGYAESMLIDSISPIVCCVGQTLIRRSYQRRVACIQFLWRVREVRHARMDDRFFLYRINLVFINIILGSGGHGDFGRLAFAYLRGRHGAPVKVFAAKESDEFS